MMNEPRVSVITVAFNAVNDIRTTLESFSHKRGRTRNLLLLMEAARTEQLMSLRNMQIALASGVPNQTVAFMTP